MLAKRIGRKTKAWRTPFSDWEKESENKAFVKEKLKDRKEKLRILLLGNIGSGKSSFINQLSFAYLERDTTSAAAGEDENGKTKMFRIYQFEEWNIEIIDSPGTKSQAFNADQVIDLIDGKRECKSYKSGHYALEEVDGGEEKHQVHCVIYTCVIDRSSDPNAHRSLDKILQAIEQRELPFFIVLTKIDTVPKIKIKKLFENETIGQAVKNIASLLKTMEENVFPVWIRKAQTDEEGKEYQDFLALITLEEILQRTKNRWSSEAAIASAADISCKGQREWFRTDIKWTNEGLLAFCNFIDAYKPPTGVERTRILLVGNSQMGKSSFVNSIYSAMDGLIRSPAPVGEAGESVTQDYTPYRLTPAIELIDSRGIAQRSQDLDKDLMDFVLKKFDVTRDEVGNIKRSARATKVGPAHESIHCVAFVVKADLDSTQLDQHVADIKFHHYLKLLRDRGMQAVALLTMVDKHAQGIQTEDIFRSKKVERKVNAISKATGCTNDCILPMINLCGQGMPTMELRILALYNLKRLLMCADDFIKIILPSQKELMEEQKKEEDTSSSSKTKEPQPAAQAALPKARRESPHSDVAYKSSESEEPLKGL